MREPSNFDPYEDTSGLFSGIKKAVSGAAKGVAKGVSTVAKGGASVVNKGAKTVGSAVKTGQGILGKVPVVGKGLVAASTLALSPYEITLNVLQGQRIDNAVVGHFKSQLGAIRDIAPYAQTVVSFVPGIGTGISGAIAAASALSEGKPITEALIAATKGALPGGPLAAAAFDVAVAAAQGKPLTEVAFAAIPLPATQKDLLRQSLQVAKDIAAGKRVDKIIIDRVNDNLSKLPKGVAQAAQIGIALGQGQNLQKTLVKAGTQMVNFKNPLVAANAIQRVAAGASKSGIAKAIGAAQALKNGSPAITRTLKAAGSQFQNGSVEKLGFDTAVAVLAKTSGNKAALAAARRALPTAAAQRAFDSAIGTVAQTVSAKPQALAQRAGSIFNPQLSKAKGTISAFQPNLKHAIETLTKNPTLATQNPLVLANKFGTTQQTVLQALKHVGSKRLLPWRSLSPNAAAYVQKWSRFAPLTALTHGTNDTAGLDETGTKYIVVKGDSPFKIAQQLTGNGNRWTELKALNTDKKPTIDKNVWVGEVLNLPPSWQKPTVKAQSPGPAVVTQPSPEAPVTISTPAPQISTVPGTLQAKSILAAWGKTDGVNEAGVSDYGANAADLSTDFGPRDKLQLKSFQNWSNKPGNDAVDLVVDGILGPKSLSALQSWAERKATATVPAGPVVTPPSLPSGSTLPEIVITGEAPKPSTPVLVSPGLPPIVATPPVVTAPPVVTSPPISVPTPSNPNPPVPVVTPPAQPGTPAAPASSGSKFGAMAAGAAVGGTLFGIPGAIIGAVAGAAIS
jgi:LysM domain